MKLTPVKYLLELWIQFEIKHLKQKTYLYKEGDIVRYNWKAKIMIYSAIKDNIDCDLIIHEVKHKRNEFINYKNLKTKKRGWVDAYWLKRVKAIAPPPLSQ